VRFWQLMAPGTRHALILLFEPSRMNIVNLFYGGSNVPESQVAVLECGGGWIVALDGPAREFLGATAGPRRRCRLTPPREYFLPSAGSASNSTRRDDRRPVLCWPLYGADRAIWAKRKNPTLFPHSRRPSLPASWTELRDTPRHDASSRTALFGTNRSPSLRSARWIRLDVLIPGRSLCRRHRRPARGAR